jgi:uncharacterized protein
MIALDTNILVYAHREDSSFHHVAYDLIVELAESANEWAIPWPCIHEFFAISTHPRIYTPPTPTIKAIEQITAWLTSPSLIMLAEQDDYWDTLKQICKTGKIKGPAVHDVRIAAICIQHGVKELWTADRDFSRVEGLGLTIRNPLV